MSPTNENISQNQNDPEAGQKIEFAQVRSFFSNTLEEIWDLRKGVDKKGTIQEINQKKSLSGANAWMLMCSIMIASIGLDRNSPAVIIGAMLISPLMAPILGIGLGVGINDRRVLKTSLLHFSVAILIAILVSTLYFAITPLGVFGSEIEARTEPTMLDIIVAIFGGIAGIISIARKDISTTIPGVAIATALMPPLCVTGYGLANWKTDIILNSFYLFFSNTFFICLSTYIIVRFLKFPFRKYPNKKEKRRNSIYISIFSILVVVPSLFILNNVINKVDTQKKIEQMLDREFEGKQVFLDDYKYIDSTKSLFLKVYGNAAETDLEEKCQDYLIAEGLDSINVTVLYTSEVNLNQIQSLNQQINDLAKSSKTSDSLANTMVLNSVVILDLNQLVNPPPLDSLTLDTLKVRVKQKFTDLKSIAIGNLGRTDFSNNQKSDLTAAILIWDGKLNRVTQQSRERALKAYLEGYIENLPKKSKSE